MTEIQKGIHLVDGSNANAYLVEQPDGSLLLIDATMQKDGRRVLDYVTKTLSKQPSEIKEIVVTHGHFDHIRGAAELKSATGGKVAVHDADADYISGKAAYPAPGGAVGILFRLISPFFKAKPVQPDIRLREGDKVGQFTILHVPGHTPGSIALYDSTAGVLFVGDTVRYLKGQLRGPPPRFTPDKLAAKASIEKLGSLDYQLVLSGHGEPFRADDAPRRLKELSKSL